MAEMPSVPSEALRILDVECEASWPSNVANRAKPAEKSSSRVRCRETNYARFRLFIWNGNCCSWYAKHDWFQQDLNPWFNKQIETLNITQKYKAQVLYTEYGCRCRVRVGPHYMVRDIGVARCPRRYCVIYNSIVRDNWTWFCLYQIFLECNAGVVSTGQYVYRYIYIYTIHHGSSYSHDGLHWTTKHFLSLAIQRF